MLILGDSLSTAYGLPQRAGWVHKLGERLVDEPTIVTLKGRKSYHVEIFNASITGETSSGGASRIATLLTRHRPAILILELGGNDGLRGLSLTALYDNLSAIIEQSHAAGAQVLLAGMQIPPNYGSRYTTEFTQTYAQLAAHYPLTLVPFLLEGIGDDPEKMQADGIHPNEAAQEQILDQPLALPKTPATTTSPITASIAGPTTELVTELATDHAT